jgi:Ca2+-transporting ATPase
MIFIALITANISLTLVNRSFNYSIIQSSKNRNYMVPMVILITIIITAAIFLIEKLTAFFEFGKLNLVQLSVTITVGFISVIWYELIKWRKRRNTDNVKK